MCLPSLVKTTSRVQWPPPRELGVAGDVGDDGLGRAGGVEVAGLVGEALDGGGVADVDVLAGCRRDRRRCRRDGRGRWRSVSICVGFAVGADAAQDEDRAGAGVGEEEIAVGRGADEARHR